VRQRVPLPASSHQPDDPQLWAAGVYPRGIAAMAKTLAPHQCSHVLPGVQGCASCPCAPNYSGVLRPLIRPPLATLDKIARSHRRRKSWTQPKTTRFRSIRYSSLNSAMTSPPPPIRHVPAAGAYAVHG